MKKKRVKRFFGIPAILMLALVILSGCSSNSTPRAALDAPAKALKNKDATAFRKVVWEAAWEQSTATRIPKAMIKNGHFVQMAEHPDQFTKGLDPWAPPALETAKITKVSDHTALAVLNFPAKNGLPAYRVFLGLHDFPGQGWWIVSSDINKSYTIAYARSQYFGKNCPPTK